MTTLPEKANSFTNQDGLEIFYRHYPSSNEKARIVIAHGIGEHSGRYGNVIIKLFPKDISIWALDHRGMVRAMVPEAIYRLLMNI